LESCWTVGHAKEYYKRLKKTSVSVESSLLFISGFDPNIVKFPTDIQLCKVFGPSKLKNKF